MVREVLGRKSVSEKERRGLPMDEDQGASDGRKGFPSKAWERASRRFFPFFAAVEI